MILKHFRTNVILRSILLGLAIFVFVYALKQDDWFMTTIFAGLAVAILTGELIRYVEKTKGRLECTLKIL